MEDIANGLNIGRVVKAREGPEGKGGDRGLPEAGDTRLWRVGRGAARQQARAAHPVIKIPKHTESRLA